jgi:glutamate synthase domain-containing protein 2
VPAAAGSGKVVRLNRSVAWENVVTGLTFTTAMTFPATAIYISICGYHGGTGASQVVRVNGSDDD